MSLVNDMLRDLDSRRQDTPGIGSGAEKLIPAGQAPRTSPGARLLQVVAVVAFLSVTGTAAALYLFERRQNDVPALAVPVVPQAAPTPAQTDPAPATPAQPSPMQAELDASMLAEMQRMMARMESLEEQNQALMQELARGSAAALAPPAPVAAHTEVAPPLYARPAAPSAPVTEPALVAQAVPQASAAVPEQPRQPLVAQAPAAPAESTLVRNRSELSFRDEDLMQVQRALEQWQGNQRRAALETLTSFTNTNPEAHQSRELLAKLLLQQGDAIRALELADAGLRIAPAHSGYRKIKARGMMAAGVPRDAAALLSSQVPSVTSDPEYHELLAAARLAAGEYDTALLSYRTLAGADPQQGRWWYGAATSLDALGRGPEAVDAYQRALQLEGLSAGLRQLSQQRIAALRQN